MQAVSCLALRTRRRNALCVIRNPRRGCPLAPITLEFADNREAAVARAEEGQGELANNHLSSYKLFNGVDRYRNCRAQRQSLLFGCAVVLAHSLRAAHFSGSEERGPRKHLPNIAGVSNGPRGRTYMAADLQLASRLRAINPGSSAHLATGNKAPDRHA